jgi:hypothetical protein
MRDKQLRHDKQLWVLAVSSPPSPDYKSNTGTDVDVDPPHNLPAADSSRCPHPNPFLPPRATRLLMSGSTDLFDTLVDRLHAARSRVRSRLGAKVRALGNLEPGAGDALASEVTDVGAPPLEGDLGQLHGKKDDDGRDGDGGGPRRGDDEVVPVIVSVRFPRIAYPAFESPLTSTRRRGGAS